MLVLVFSIAASIGHSESVRNGDLRELVLTGKHGADGVGCPGEVEQVGVEEAEGHVGGGAPHCALSLRQQHKEEDMSPAAACSG